MRSNFLFLVFSFSVLAACVPATPAPTVTSVVIFTPTPSPLPTETISPTSEPTAVPEVELKGFVYDPARTEIVESVYLGVDFYTTITVSKDFDPFVQRVDIKESGVNGFTEIVARGLWSAWREKGGPGGIGPKDKNGKTIFFSFEDFMKMLAEAQNGERPWEEMQISIKADKMFGDKYNPEKVMVWLGYNGDPKAVPENVVAIRGLNINFIFDKPNSYFPQTEASFGYAHGVSIYDQFLSLNIGFTPGNFDNHNIIIGAFTTIGNLLKRGEVIGVPSLDKLLDYNDIEVR